MKTIQQCIPKTAVLLGSMKRTDSTFLHTVICEYEGNFVTWVVNAQTGGAYHGFYHENQVDAYENFFKRIKDYHPDFQPTFKRN